MEKTNNKKRLAKSILLTVLCIGIAVGLYYAYYALFDTTEKEKEEISNVVTNFISVTTNIGETIDTPEDEMLNIEKNEELRLNACKASAELYDRTSSFDIRNCDKFSRMRYPEMSTVLFRSKYENLDITDIEIKENEAIVKFNLDLYYSLSMRAITEYYEEDNGPTPYIFGKSKEPIEVRDAKIKLKRTNGTWLISDDSSMRDKLRQFYSNWSESTEFSDFIYVDYDKIDFNGGR